MLLFVLASRLRHRQQVVLCSTEMQGGCMGLSGVVVVTVAAGCDVAVVVIVEAG